MHAKTTLEGLDLHKNPFRLAFIANSLAHQKHC